MIRQASQNNMISIGFDTATIAVPFGGTAPIRLGAGAAARRLRLRGRGPGVWLALVAILIGDVALAWLARIAVDFVTG